MSEPTVGARGPVQWLLPIALIVVALAAYHNSFRGPFVFDDEASIVTNPSIRSLWPIQDVLSPPAQIGTAGRPVLNLSLAVNYALGELDPFGYHVLNLVIHIAAGLLLFGIVRRTLCLPRLEARYAASAPWLAASVAAIWLAHPLQTGSVTFVIQRAESLMSAFYLATLYGFVRVLDSRRVKLWSVLSVVACVLGMATKEVMVTAPIVVLLYDRTFAADGFVDALRKRGWLHASLAATWIPLATLVASGARTESVGLGFAHLTPFDYLKTQAGVIVHYLRLAVWPHPLVLDYGWPAARGWSKVWAPGLAVIGLLCATAWALRARPIVGFLGACVFLILAPSSSILPIASEIAAEHRMYLALAPLVVLAVFGMDLVLGRCPGASVRRFASVALAVGTVSALAWASAARNTVYATTLSLWRDVVREAPWNARGHNGVAVALLESGKPADALGPAMKAVELEPANPRHVYTLGSVYLELGRWNEAIERFAEVVRLDPKEKRAYASLASACLKQGRIDEAVRSFRGALDIDPAFAAAESGLGLALLAQGKVAPAMAKLESAVRRAPNDASVHFNLALGLLQQGRMQEAVERLREALRIDPAHAESRLALGRVQSQLGRAPDAR